MRTFPLLLLVLLPQPAAGFDAEAFYQESCAACHGPRGEGLDESSPRYATFRTPPADLSEPLFNSMEPSADWYMVIKYGGARMGLSAQMPAYEGAISDRQIGDVVAHLKTLADTERYPPGDMNFLRPIRTIKPFPENELLWITRAEDREEGSDRIKNTLYYARRFGARFQGELKLIHLASTARSELDEVELGLKWAFFDDLDRSLLVAAGLESEVPVHDDAGDPVWIPYLSLAHGLTDELQLQSTLRSHLPSEDASDGDLELSAVIHSLAYPWPRGAFPAIESTFTAPFHGDVEVTLIPQVYVALNRRGHVALSLGFELPLTDLHYDYRFHAFLLWDMADGRLWEGW